jgi:hypothetical protein
MFPDQTVNDVAGPYLHVAAPYRERILTTANFSKLQKFLPADLRIDAEEEFANSLKAISDGAQSPASLTVRRRCLRCRSGTRQWSGMCV